MNREADIRDYMKAAIEEGSAPRSCPSAEELAAHLRNEGDADSRESIQEHLVGCHECGSALLELSGFVAAGAQPAPPARDPILERKWQELQRRLHSEQRPTRSWTAWLSGFRLAVVFSAACLIASVTWALVLQSKLSTVEIAYRRLSDQQSQNDAARQRSEAQIAELRAPQLNLPVFDVLPAGLANRSEAGQPANTFALPAAGRFAFVLSGAARRASAEYSITISHELGGDVYSGEGLKPDNQGNLLMTLDRSFLPAGAYRLIVGQKAGSGFQSIAAYLIRLVDQRESPKIENPAQ